MGNATKGALRLNVDHDVILGKEMRRGCLYSSEYQAEDAAYVVLWLAGQAWKESAGSFVSVRSSVCAQVQMERADDAPCSASIVL